MFFNRNFSRNCWAFTVIMCIASVSYAVPFSQYGLIQGVQDYSNNPFYNPNNGTITTPQVVYNPGPVLNNTDCISLVNAVIQNVCAAQNNCKNKSLPDVRKDIMVTLSSSGFTGAASTCGGYIDYQFEQYKKQNTFATGASGTPFPTSFPTAQQKTTTKTDPTISKEQAAYNERAAELKALQSENGVGTTQITKTDFPTTFDDLSFTQRNAIKQAGYEKYKDAKVYVPLNIEYDPKYAKSKGGGGGGGGGGGNTTSECQKVYSCISGYTSQEEEIIKDFQTNLDVDAYKKAMADVLYSALCTCTKNKNTYRTKLGVTDICNKSADKAKELFIDEINKIQDTLVNTSFLSSSSSGSGTRTSNTSTPFLSSFNGGGADRSATTQPSTSDTNSAKANAAYQLLMQSNPSYQFQQQLGAIKKIQTDTTLSDDEKKELVRQYMQENMNKKKQ